MGLSAPAAAATEGSVWLDVAPNILSAAQTSMLESLLQQGLKRRGLALSTHSDGQAIWVVQVRAIESELFVLVASGPALPGSGVSKSRRIETAGLGPDVLPLSLAQAGEELVDAAANTKTPPPPPAAPPPTTVVTKPAPPPPPPPSPWGFAVDLGGELNLFPGLSLVGGDLAARAYYRRVGLVARVGFSKMLAAQTSLGRIAGDSLSIELGPALRLTPGEDWTLELGLSAQARWLRGEGSAAGEGLVGKDGSGWAWLGLGSLTLRYRLAAALELSLRAAGGPVLRGLRLEGLGQRLLTLSDAMGTLSFALSLGPP